MQTQLSFALTVAQEWTRSKSMTEKQKCLRACSFAVIEMIGRGSSSLVIDVHSGNPSTIEWKDVLEWIEKEEAKE